MQSRDENSLSRKKEKKGPRETAEYSVEVRKKDLVTLKGMQKYAIRGRVRAQQEKKGKPSHVD